MAAANGDPSTSASAASPPPSPAHAKEKPVVVRVKRKPSQARLDAFWLEINERPTKKAMLDLASLSISDSGVAKVPAEPRSKKLFVQHVDTVQHPQSVEDVLHSLLQPDSDFKQTKSTTKECYDRIRQDRKQDQLRSKARQTHEDLIRNARIAQIWRSRKGGKDEGDDESLREICHLYDVVQVDPEEEKPRREPGISSFEEGAILCNYLPLIRELLPTAAEEIEADVISMAQSKDSHVYDIYTVMDGDDVKMEDMTTMYPLLQVDDDSDGFYDGPGYCGYDTDDSNAEDNPLFDYPDEESGDDSDEGDEFRNPFDDLEGSDSQYEKEEVEVRGDEDYYW